MWIHSILVFLIMHLLCQETQVIHCVAAGSTREKKDLSPDGIINQSLELRAMEAVKQFRAPSSKKDKLPHWATKELVGLDWFAL